MIGDTMQEKISIGNVEVLSVVDMFPPGRATSFFPQTCLKMLGIRIGKSN